MSNPHRGVNFRIGDIVRIGSRPQKWRIVGERTRTSHWCSAQEWNSEHVDFQLEAILPGDRKETRIWQAAIWLRLVERNP